MKTREPRPAPLILRDLLGSTMLTVTGSNQGEPYRETLLLDFSGTGPDPLDREPIASVELEPAEETELRALLNARFRRYLRTAAEHRGEGRTFLVTDFDRIRGRMHADAGAALREAEGLSRSYPGNAIHVLGTTAVAVSGELRALHGPEPTTAAKDALWVLLEAHRGRLFEPAENNGDACGYRFGDTGETVLYLQNVEARRLLQGHAEPPIPAEAEPPGRAVLAADVQELAAQLRTLVAYARWQIEEGGSFHPTLRSAVGAAEQALFARGLDKDAITRAEIARLIAATADADAR